MVDETSSSAEWHIPRAHYLESWGDARAVGGTLSVVQPLILPLFGGRTPVEVLGLMVGDKDRPGYDIVRDTWKPILGEAEFDKKWNRVLHDGLLAGSELTEVVPSVKGEAFAELARATGSASGLEIVFVPSPSLHDGRFANDGWLQELPDPLTKLTWDNPALVSPKTAEIARSCERGCDPSRLCEPLARASRLDPSRHGGRRGGPDPWLRASTRGADWIRGRVRHVHGPTLAGTWLRQRRHTHQARTHVPAFGDPGPRQHGGAPPRPRVHAGRTSICRKRRRPGPARSASSRRNRSTSHSGRSTPTIRATSGG